MSQCWAHNIDKVRCELDAGHDLLHKFSISWSDAECYEPGKNITTSPLMFNYTTPAAPPSTPPPQPVSKCVACQHQHKGKNPCPVGSCECYEFIG